ncbi:hypothetical protein FH972_025074 [Carpinus fangiana]|uniref:Phosphatidylserine decarboxylase proenzyme 1, mitochondrial n=1 Tax=Carpinus fangiana TaxID=176857 RepID=A0A5N6KZZ4_9ROSI|nr:hypothetical protein FH972_025074 [Carpinus fangiana]
MWGIIKVVALCASEVASVVRAPEVECGVYMGGGGGYGDKCRELHGERESIFLIISHLDCASSPLEPDGERVCGMSDDTMMGHNVREAADDSRLGGKLGKRSGFFPESNMLAGKAKSSSRTIMTPARALRSRPILAVLYRSPRSAPPIHPSSRPSASNHVFPIHRRTQIPRTNASPYTRHFTSSSRRCEQRGKDSFYSRLREALGRTRIQWAPIPVGLGIGFLGFLQFRRMQDRDRFLGDRPDDLSDSSAQGKVGRRERIRPSGPWTVQVMSTLPLKAISRIWGKFNELDIPFFPFLNRTNTHESFDEVAEPDLRVYPNLAAFFYRELKPGVRPLDPNPNALLSPADGKVVQFGTIEHGEVEQVKGVTYSLDALLGAERPGSSPPSPSTNTPLTNPFPRPSDPAPLSSDNEGEDRFRTDEEFARVNGISYSLPNLFSGNQDPNTTTSPSAATDQSTKAKKSSERAVYDDLTATTQESSPWWSPFATKPTDPTTLYYMVVYLAPGDYHRFHSPVSWVVTARRHFAGELYSVSPYLVRTLPGLFTLNERVVLLGRWRHGFFSYTPVGATNVGSIVINFDKELRTNSLTTDTAADRAAAAAKERGEAYSGFAEATYGNASEVLGGHALKRGEEMGGFQLGSTIVMVFEAPKGVRRRSFDEGFTDKGDERKGGWKWDVEKGMKVKVGQSLGHVIEEDD